jgi:DNA (cytosine-5)-methyltransferase 1
MRVADFFCGAGGFSEGFRQAGFQIVFAVDKWSPAVNTYRANQSGAKTIKDDVIRISELADDEFDRLVPDTEIIIGSPPCVAFSNSNRSGNGDKTLGLRLLHAYLRIIARKKFKRNSALKYWMLENVLNIQKYIKPSYAAADLGMPGMGEDAILCPIGDSSGIYNAKYFGVPSNRKRFLCGEFPKPVQMCTDETVVPMQRVLDALGEPCHANHSRIVDCNYPNLVLPTQDVSDHQYEYIVQEFECEKLKRLKQDKGYMGRMSFPEDTTKPSRTIMATMSASSRESMILKSPDGRYRLPTVREAASMMSFPLDYRFYGITKGIKYTLVGNAVPPKLSYAIAAAICAKEGLSLPSEYHHIVHDDCIEFVDLNGSIMPERREKPKRADARFRYHIPYLIIRRYRVELANVSRTDSKHRRDAWKVELHHGQGKGEAKTYTPRILAEDIDGELRDRVGSFVKDMVPQLCSGDEFQRRHCMTAAERKDLVGPYELLERTREFIDATFSDDEKRRMVQIHDDPKHVPQAVAVGYYILRRLTRAIGGMSNERRDKKAGIVKDQGIARKHHDDGGSSEVQGKHQPGERVPDSP